MLRITIPQTELWDEKNEELLYIKEQTLQLEHSLVSISKWESKWHKPFLSKKPKTDAEVLDYIKCMTITQNVDPNTYFGVPSSEIEKVNAYIDDSMTATTISDIQTTSRRSETVTSELIYHWMIVLGIPFECQKWHLNRLLTLIRVCEIKSRKPRKRSQQEIIRDNIALNAANRKRFNTRG